VTHESSHHGASTRSPVVHGGRRIPGLWQRSLKDGTVRYEAQLRIDGSPKRVPLEATTRFDAVRELAALKVDRDRGHVNENPLVNPTVTDVFDEWLDHMQSRVELTDRRYRYAQSTVDTRRRVINGYLRPVLGPKRIAQVTTADIRRLAHRLQQAGLAPLTVNEYLGLTGTMFKFAVKNGYRDDNPCRNLGRDDKPARKRKSEPRYLAADEVQALLENASIRYRPIFAVMVYAGLRVGEALGLQWRNLDFGQDTVNIDGEVTPDCRYEPWAKSESSEAPVPMLPALKRELLDHRRRQATGGFDLVRPDAFVFTSVSGRHLTHSPVYMELRKAGDVAGINPEGLEAVSSHDLRHTCVSLAIHYGATPVEAQELARHADVTTTMNIYAGLTKDGKGRAARKMLDAGFGT
jgi:integrase